MPLSWADAGSRYAAIASVDPYIDLAFGTEVRFFPARHQAERISVLLRLADTTSIGDFANGSQFTQGASWSELVRVPALYRRPVAGLEDQRYCTAYVKQELFFDLLQKSPTLQSAIARVSLGLFSATCPRPEESVPAESVPAEPTGVPELGTVVMAVIDDGLAFAHRRFRLAEFESRIEYLWLQDGAEDRAGPPLPYGRELRKQDIDGLLARYAASGVVDEDDLYRRAGVFDLSSRRHQSIVRRAAHGTHVMDLACGYDFHREARHDRPVVCVQLPSASTEDTSGATLDDYGLDAIRYILDRADAIARRRGSTRLPVVINFSYGNVAGPHDGSSDLEQAIDALVRARGTTPMGQNLLHVVLPAGNSNLGRLHAKVTLGAEPVDLHWKVLPDDKTPSFMEIWLPDSRPGQVRLRITPPGGEPGPSLEQASGAGIQWRENDDVLCEARYREIAPPTGRGLFLIALQPTTLASVEARKAAEPVAPSGVWTVTLEKVPAGAALTVEAWIQRDDTPFGYRRRGRQSFFDEPCYRRFDRQGRPIETDDHPDQPPCHVRRAGSISAIATGAETTVVSGRLGKEGRLAGYSARAADSEVSDDSLVHGGVLAAGTRGGSIIALRGTSVAAPQRARRLADELGPPKSQEPQPRIPRPRRFRGQPAAE